MSLVGLDPPDFRTVSDFRKRHLRALAGLFAQVLKLCRAGGKRVSASSGAPRPI
jgi:transposase